MSRGTRIYPVRTLRGARAPGGFTIAFWITAGFFVGVATSIGARVLLCPSVDAPPPETGMPLHVRN